MRVGLLHPAPSLATTAAAVAFGLIFGMGPGDRRLALVAVTILLTQFSISALNDWADRERDAAAGLVRPVAQGRIPPPLALGLAVSLGVAAAAVSLTVGSVSIALVLIGLGLGWAYDLVFKPTPLSFLPFALAFPLLAVWVGVVSGRPLPALLVLFLAGAPLATAIHLADALPDARTDAAAGLHTLSTVLGERRTVRVMQALLVLGALVMVAASVERPVFAVLIGLAAAVGTTLTARVASTRRAVTRWVVSATALVMVAVWLVRWRG